MKLIEEDELHQKFCDKLNNLDGDGFGKLPIKIVNGNIVIKEEV